MFDNLRPDYIFSSIYEIPAKFFTEHNIKLLLVDLDNTLTGDESLEQPATFQPWLQNIQALGIEVIIVSNNRSADRVIDFLGDVTIEWYHHAHKQNGDLFIQILADKQISPKQVAVIGDRIFTDIVGGNKVHALTILTQPISKDQNKLVGVFRLFERLFRAKNRRNNA